MNKLKSEDSVVGDGPEAVPGKTLRVNYIGWLENGNKFDASKDNGEPFEFRLGGKQVIAGWDEGVKGMKVGGKRKLTIPPEMGFGARGFPPIIPPNSVLIFDIELIEVK
jgi:FKBP-type peptidyl-prolyl cis-trans isomerase